MDISRDLKDKMSENSFGINNNIGADYTNQTLIDFDWYNPHLYHVPQEFLKSLTYLFFFSTT